MVHRLSRRALNQAACVFRRSYASASNASAANPTSIANLLDRPPAEGINVTINGLVRSIRNQKTRSFVAVGDGSSLEPLQALLSPTQAQSLTTGSAVCLTGVWKASPNAKNQSHELHVSDVGFLGDADPATFPLQKKYHTPEFLRAIPHLRTRTPFNSLMLRFRSQSIAQITRFFSERDFVQTHPPIITSSDCEGAGEAFEVTTGEDRLSPGTARSKNATPSFYKSQKYLTVSSQLHLEALAQSVGKVWTLSPTFRAEKSDTYRHLSEFYMLEVEVNYAAQMASIMDLVEDMLRDLTTGLCESRVYTELLQDRRSGDSGTPSEMISVSGTIESRWAGMMSKPWPRITYTEAIEVLQKSGTAFEYDAVWGHGLQAEHERFIATHVGKGKPVFVTQYPRDIKAFYMLPSTTSPQLGPTVDCFDLLVPESCEIAGGSMREYRYSELLNAMQSHGVIHDGDSSDEALGSLKWYADLRRWGTAPHGGFGIGFDRLLGYLAGVQNIREVVGFPRWYGRCDC